MSFDTDYSLVYDALYWDKSYEDEAAYIESILTENDIPKSPAILEVGMGTGKHASLLADSIRGASIVGLEPSHEMASQARLRGLNVEELDALEGLNLKLENSFDAVLAIFHVVSYMTQTEELEAFFSEVYRTLRPGGIILFDVWHKPAVLGQRMEERVKRGTMTDGRQVIRIASPALYPATSTAEVNYEIFLENADRLSFKRIAEQHVLRFFDKNELEGMLGACGLQVLQSHEFLSCKPPSESTWGVAYVARKPFD